VLSTDLLELLLAVDVHANGWRTMQAALFALALLLSQIPLVLLPCIQSDSTAVCHCKQGMASACAALTEAEEEMLKGLARAAAMVKAAQEAQKAQKAKAQVTDSTGCGSGQDPNEKQECTGQGHHILSKTVWYALERHDVLRGKYTYRDPRFVTHAKDLKAHCGWQGWHRAIDDEIVAWLDTYGKATAEQFEAYLREVYARPELRVRFPNGF